MARFFWLAAVLASMFSCAAANAAERYKLRVFDDINPAVRGVSPSSIGSRRLLVGNALNYSPPDQFFRMAVQWVDGDLRVLTRPGTGQTYAYAANAAGEVVGQASLALGSPGFPILWRPDGSWIVLPPLVDGLYAYATSINRHGHVAGCGWEADDLAYAVVWRKNAPPTKLDSLPEGAVACAFAIAGHGWVGGATYLDETTQHATVWKDGAPLDIGTLGGARAQVTSINSRGEAVGWSYTDGQITRPFLWSNGVLVELDTLGGVQGWVYDINDQGVAVGAASVVNAGNRPLMWAQGQAIDLNDLLDDKARQAGWVLRSASGIDERGDVIGVASTLASPTAYYPFILTKLSD